LLGVASHDHREMPHKPLSERFEPHRLVPAWPFKRTEYRLGDTPIVHLHRHEVLELGLCNAGSGTYLIEDKEFHFTAGDALVIGPRELHWSRSDPGTTSSWTYLFADPLRLLSGLPDVAAVVSVSDLAGPRFGNLLRPAEQPRAVALIGMLAERRTASDRAQVRGLLLALMAELHGLPGRSAGVNRSDEGERLAPALRLLGERYQEDLSIPALAAACALGETTFRRAFHAAFGHGPKEYLIRLRLTHAAARLRSGRSVTEAALGAGFATLSSFHRHFRARYGQAPRTLVGMSGG
jgi:AraC family transcriptional regulator, activator of mtrCDE